MLLTDIIQCLVAAVCLVVAGILSASEQARKTMVLFDMCHKLMGTNTPIQGGAHKIGKSGTVCKGHHHCVALGAHKIGKSGTVCKGHHHCVALGAHKIGKSGTVCKGHHHCVALL